MNLAAKLRFLARISYIYDAVYPWIKWGSEEDLCGDRRLADKAMFAGSGLNGRSTILG